MNESGQSYLDKLRDPRWQKKRLEVMQRDKWTCQSCDDVSSPLNVHHKDYRQGLDPWEYELEELVTLCETCHEAERTDRLKAEKRLLTALRKSGFLSGDLLSLSETLECVKMIGESVDAKTVTSFLCSHLATESGRVRLTQYMEEYNRIADNI